MDAPGAFALIVVNHGSHALLERNITAALVGWTVIVVDNPSTRTERIAVGKLCRERGWELVASPFNDGFGAGVNRGVRAAIELGCEVFVLLNPDASADAATLDALARDVREDPLRVVSPRVLTPAGRVEFRGAVVSLLTGRIRSGWIADDGDPEWVNWLAGACMAFSGELFERVGGFAEDYFLYWEDLDFSRRAVAHGAHLDVRSDLAVLHDEGGTQDRHGGPAKSHLYYYWNCRNRLVFGRRFHRGQWRTWVTSSPAQSWRILLRGGRRQILSDPGTLWAAIRGTLGGAVVCLRGPVDSLGPVAGPAVVGPAVATGHPMGRWVG